GALDGGYRSACVGHLRRRADEVAELHSLDRHDAALPLDHAASEQFGMRSHLGWEVAEAGLDQMIRNVRKAPEPEVRDLREDLSLVGDAGGEDDVERRNAVGGDEKKRLAEVVHVAYFSSASQREGERHLQNRGRHGARLYFTSS